MLLHILPVFLPVFLAAATTTPRPPVASVALVTAEGINEPFAVAFDAADNVYIAEMAPHRITVRGADGQQRVLAGSGREGFAGDGGPAAKAEFRQPHHLLTGPDGALYVADTHNNCVRRIDLKTGMIHRVAGTGEKGFAGDGGPALAASFAGIYAIAIHGDTLYACDLGNRRIRAIDRKSGIVTTVAGNGDKGIPKDGADARTQPLVDPRAVAVDSKGRLYICERGGHALRRVETDGTIRTVAGTGAEGYSGDGGPALQAAFRGPKHISVDSDDSVLITDTENHTVRRYSPGDGMVRRVIGSGEPGAGGVGGPPEACQLKRPHGAEAHPRTHLLYISDSDNHRVLRINR